MIFLIDDINMGHRDRWQHHSTLELMRQWFDYNGWYATSKATFSKIRDISFCATLTLRQGEKQALDERFLWHWAGIGVLNFEGCHMEQIFA